MDVFILIDDFTEGFRDLVGTQTTYSTFDTLSVEDAKKFFALSADKKILTKAKLENYVNAGLLKRLPNTEILVDKNDPDIVLGNTMEEAVIYAERQENKAAMSEYETIYKNYKKK